MSEVVNDPEILHVWVSRIKETIEKVMIRATVEQVEVMDPISLSRRYPTEMPGARHVLNDE
jgi:hypothetical protein